MSFEGPNAEAKEVSFDPGFDEWEVRFKAAAPGGDAMFIMYFVGSPTSSGIWLQVDPGNLNLLLDENQIYSDTFDNTEEHEYVLRYENDDITLTRDDVQLFSDTIGSLPSTVHHFLAYQESPTAYGWYKHLCIAEITA